MMRKFRHFTAVAISSLIILSCDHTVSSDKTKTEDGESFNLAAAKATIDSTNKVMSENITKGDSVAMAAHYTKDAKIFPDKYPMMSGADAIKALWSGFISQGINLSLAADDVWGDNDLLVEEGKYTVSDKKGTALDKGKYLVLWKLEDGKWKLFRDIWNSDGAMTAK